MVSKNKRLLQRVRVPLGFLFAGVFIYFAEPTVVSMAVGVGIVLIGVAIRSWASGHIRKAQQLAISGPYAFTRNPLYFGSAFLGAGFAAASGVWWLVLVFLALYLSIYLPVMRVEETDIGNIFGAEYDEYKANVPLFLPRLTPWKKTGTKFDFQLYLHHREYRAALGFGIALALLAAKAPVLSWVMRSFFSISLLVFVAAFAFVGVSAQPEKQTKTLPFANGELLTYEGKISRLGIGISVADVTFSVDQIPDSTNHRVKAKATSKGTLLKLFGFSFLQEYESVVDFAGQRVIKTTKHDVQKERIRDSIADFDYAQKRVSFTENDPNDANRPPRRIASKIVEPMYDLVTGIYSIRDMKLSVGKSFDVSLSDSGLVYEVPVRVTKRELQKTIFGKVWCWRIEPAIFGRGRLIEQKGSMIIWLTDDDRKTPVRSQINTTYGKVDVRLKSASK